MTKEEILESLKEASEQGDIKGILELTEKLKTLDEEKPKVKRGRPKKVAKVFEDEESVPIEDNPTVKIRKKSAAKDKFIEQFRVPESKTNKINTGRSMAWRKPKHIEFLDDRNEALGDIAIDKKLKVQENVPRRDMPQKVEVVCKVCHQKEKVYEYNVKYTFDDQTGEKEQMEHLCNGCRPS